MRDAARFFDTLKDTSLPREQRLSFAPYMLFFSLASPDLKTLMMKSDKCREDQSLSERKFNDFIMEDNFHYNYLLHDIERLGYTIERFGTTSAVIRHVFAEESIAVRQLIYTMASYIHSARDSLVAMAIPEILEAGLFDLFTTVYSHIVDPDDNDSPYRELRYFGSTHVRLEQNHTVTRWFAPNHPRDPEVAELVVPEETYKTITLMVDELMGRFGAMYAAFDEIIRRNSEITPEKFQVTGDPPINKITTSA